MEPATEGGSVYAEMAQYYDRIYSFKEYAVESEQLIGWIGTHIRSSGRRLLDVACGTGRHLEYLSKTYDAEGLDLSPGLLELARKRNPRLTFHCADMRTFDLPSRYDVVTCLFSAIGYMTTREALAQAIATMAKHLVPGGLLVIEPWFTPETWKPGTVHAMLIDDPDLKIARVNTSLTIGGLSVMDLHHLVGTPTQTNHFVEHHEMGLYTEEDMREAIRSAGLTVRLDADGLTGRGLYFGVKADA
jgi:SAM-dependent methyltransferase